MKKTLVLVIFAALLGALQSCDMSKYNVDNEELNNQIRALVNATRDELNADGFALRLAYSADGEDISFIVFAQKGENCRWDAFDDDYSYAVYYADEKGWEYESLNMKAATTDEWKEITYQQAVDKVQANYNDLVADASDVLKDYGFSMTGTTEIFGITCDVWSGTYTIPSGKSPVHVYGAMTLTEGTKGEFCVWNGLTLRTTVNGKGQTECSGIVKNLPNKTFTNTRDLSWL